MHFTKKAGFVKGQGTIEYLVVIGVVVVISLVVVGLMTSTIGSSSSSVTSTSGKISQATSMISITDAVVDLDGNGIISLKNNSGTELNITKIIINGKDSNYNSGISLPQGSNIPFGLINLGSFCTCDYAGQIKSCEIKIYSYTTYDSARLDKEPIIITASIDCVEEVNATNPNNVIRPDITQNSQTPISLCPYTISSPGEYGLTGNLSSTGTCIKVNSNDVNIYGNGHSITGNNTEYGIDASAQDSDAYDNLYVEDITLSNFSIDIYSNGVGNPPNYTTAYKGGSITIINSTISSITSNASFSPSDGGSARGGAITIWNSNIGSISTTGSYGEPYRRGGMGGDVNVYNSTIQLLESNGGWGGYHGGSGGTINISNSRVINVTSKGGDNTGDLDSAGNGGIIRFYDSNTTYVSVHGGDQNWPHYWIPAGNGGSVIFNSCPSIIPSVDITGGIHRGGGSNGASGTIDPPSCTT